MDRMRTLSDATRESRHVPEESLSAGRAKAHVLGARRRIASAEVDVLFARGRGGGGGDVTASGGSRRTAAQGEQRTLHVQRSHRHLPCDEVGRFGPARKSS